ncbi:MAG: hypothetical protein C4542_08930 [Dehalococcoidia bacterium]|nr:MAG: hypothetical protein C4542_08930 [Dehalococcoidia bacterium]
MKGPIVAGLFGLVLGAAIGYGAEGDWLSAIVRGCLTAFSMVFLAVLHRKLEVSTRVWGEEKTARRQHERLVAERNRMEGYMEGYQNEQINRHETHAQEEAERSEGFVSGKQARKDWVRPSYKNLALLFVMLLSAAFTSHAFAADAVQTAIIVDITEPATSALLAQQAAQRLNLNYGDSVRVFLVGCGGLRLIFQGEVTPVSRAHHRQSLKDITAKVKDVLLKEAVAAQDTQCSPLLDTLQMLAAELQLLVAQGDKVSLLVASDLEANSDQLQIQGEPFKGIPVRLVMSPPMGRNAERRLKALTLVPKLFAGAKLTITN